MAAAAEHVTHRFPPVPDLSSRVTLDLRLPTLTSSHIFVLVSLECSFPPSTSLGDLHPSPCTRKATNLNCLISGCDTGGWCGGERLCHSNICSSGILTILAGYFKTKTNNSRRTFDLPPNCLKGIWLEEGSCHHSYLQFNMNEA